MGSFLLPLRWRKAPHSAASSRLHQAAASVTEGKEGGTRDEAPPPCSSAALTSAVPAVPRAATLAGPEPPPLQHNRVDFVNAEELKVVELRFINGEWRPARIAEPHSAASLGVHASQALTASAASLGKRPSYVHGMELKTGSKRTLGVQPPAATAAAGRGATDSAGGGSGGLLHSGRVLPSHSLGPAEQRMSRAGTTEQQHSRRSLPLPPLPPTQEAGPTN